TFVQSKVVAQEAFLIHHQAKNMISYVLGWITDDRQLKKPHYWLKIIPAYYLKKALALAPLQEEYLEAIINYEHISDEERYVYAKRKLLFIDPSSLEHEDYAAQLGIFNKNENPDYLDAAITEPFIQEILKLPPPPTLSLSATPMGKEELAQIALEMGVNPETLREMEGDLETLINYLDAHDRFSFDDLQSYIQFYRRLEKAYALAPDNLYLQSLRVVNYGRHYPKVLLGVFPYNKASSDFFYQEILGKPRPRKKDKKADAIQSLEKATVLKDAFLQNCYLAISQTPAQVRQDFSGVYLEGFNFEYLHPLDKEDKLDAEFCLKMELSFNALFEASYINFSLIIPQLREQTDFGKNNPAQLSFWQRIFMFLRS
ncbi:MAG: hypothetical protein AAFU64_18635, partial [Bacteroidota bacterium]